MNVFKFGGASVKNAAAIARVGSIIQAGSESKLLVVVSAMGSTTDLLEEIVSRVQDKKNISNSMASVRGYHFDIAKELFPAGHKVYAELETYFGLLEAAINLEADYDCVYDQAVSFGEIISSVILSHYLNLKGLPCRWTDARHYIQTDNCFREGKVDWEETRRRVQPLRDVMKDAIIVTQGFLGSTPEGLTTTLGREGSDFSAAIFGACLDAGSVTIWKDVAGVMNADPKRLSTARVFDELPFREAAEMTYYGASIIHPKTIKPLANKGIALYVKSFLNPQLEGTHIYEFKAKRLPPLIVFKEDQCLISCNVTDYSFIQEREIGIIFQTLAERNIKINVMQNSAISFSFCIDFHEHKTRKLIDHLAGSFEVFYNTGLTLITIKNYDPALHQEYRNKPGVILEQSSRSTLQLLLKP